MRPAGRRGAAGGRPRRPHVRGHCELALERHVPDLPAPPRHTASSSNEDEELVPARIDVPPAHSSVASRTLLSPRTSTGSSATRPSIRAPGPPAAPRAARGSGASAARNRSHRVATEPVGDEPLALRRLVEAPDRPAPKEIVTRPRRRRQPRHQLGERGDLRSPAAADQVGDDPGPPRLVRGAEPGAVVAVEVLVEEDVVLPVGSVCISRPSRSTAAGRPRRRGRARSAGARMSSAISPRCAAPPTRRVLERDLSPKYRA